MKELPIVLVLIDSNSRLDIIQSDGVLVGFLDMREEAHECAVLMPRKDGIEEILAAMSGRVMLSRDEDRMEIALKTLGRIARREVIVAGLKDAAE